MRRFLRYVSDGGIGGIGGLKGAMLVGNLQKVSSQRIGYYPIRPEVGTATLALNAAATWLALSFVPSDSKTLSSLEIRCAGVAGTLGANDLTCDIYDDASGRPGVSLASSNTLQSPIASGSFAIFTGFSLALSPGVQYWAVFKNVNATPAANNVTWRFGGGGTSAQVGFPSATAPPSWGWHKNQTTNSGATWPAFVSDVFGLRLNFSDSTHGGEPIASAAFTGASVGVFGSNELGASFVTPQGLPLVVKGIAMSVGLTGAPPGSARLRLYIGNTLVGTTPVIPSSVLTTTPMWVTSYFPTSIILPAATTVRAMIGTTGGGDAANFYKTAVNNIANDPDTQALFPFGSIASPTNVVKQSYYDGVSFTDNAAVLMPFALLLDNAVSG